ncbi:MAG: hydrogenase maturation protease [Formivibrio sp.]|nr:hydrogenase maturation protease [Formivibrio sp.]
MAETRVIGIGSPFGADRLGWAVIDALHEVHFADKTDLAYCRLPAELPDLMTGYSRVILVDALLGDCQVGTPLRLMREDLPHVGLGVSSHGFNVAAALELAAVLGSLPDQLLLLGLEVGESNQPINPEWIKRLVQMVQAELACATD